MVFSKPKTIQPFNSFGSRLQQCEKKKLVLRGLPQVGEYGYAPLRVLWI